VNIPKYNGREAWPTNHSRGKVSQRAYQLQRPTNTS
jgi:hypothetical protein